jgi:hypothetical protein
VIARGACDQAGKHMPNVHAMTHAAAPPHVHEPEVHASPRMPHALPQPPQLLRSVCVFTHVMPPQHSWLAPHARPHAPQFATVSTRVHVPSQHI